MSILARFAKYLIRILRRKLRPPTGTEEVKIPWLSWEQHSKVTIGSQEYARVGNRLYTHHAVERTYPSSLGTAVGGVKGRSVAPGYIQEVLSSPGTTRIPVTGPLGEARVSHVSGSLEVITEGDIVITVMTH